MAAKLLTIAFRNMRRQLRRTILTGMTFAIAVFIFTVLIAVPWSMDRIADNASKELRLVVTERNNGRLPARYCGPIRKLQHVLGCAAEILWTATYRDPKNPVVTYGVNSDLESITGTTDYRISPEATKLIQTDRRIGPNPKQDFGDILAAGCKRGKLGGIVYLLISQRRTRPWGKGQQITGVTISLKRRFAPGGDGQFVRGNYGRPGNARHAGNI